MDNLDKDNQNQNNSNYQLLYSKISDKRIINNYFDNPKKIQIYYHFYVLRIISSFAVVLIHISIEYYYKRKCYSYDYKISCFYNGISRFAVPIFYMISGALFLNRDISYKTMYNKYIKRLLLHLIIWSFIYSISNLQLSKINIKNIFLKFIETHYHLWFLLSIIGLYILVPFLREITKKDDLLKMFMILSFIFTFLFRNFIIFLSYYSKPYSVRLNKIYRHIDLNYISGNVYYFMLGNYINNIIDITFFIEYLIYIFGLFGLYFTIALPNYNTFKKHKILFFHPRDLNIAAYSISIFVFIKNHFNNNKNYGKKLNLIKMISKYSFGIYLVHPLIIETMKKMIIYRFLLSIKILFRIPLTAIIIYLSSLLFSMTINYIPFTLFDLICIT